MADLEAFRNLRPHANGRHLSYLRYPTIEATQEDRIVYLDTDTLVLGDLAELVPLLPADRALAAVQDRFSASHSSGDPYSLDGAPNTSDAPYFNSGVLLIDKTKLPFASFAEAFRHWASRVSEQRFSDQTFVNIVFKEQWHPLPAEWNLLSVPHHPASLDIDGRRAGVIHFVTANKPWSSGHYDVPNLLWYGIARNLHIEVPPEVEAAFQREKSMFLRRSRRRLRLRAKRALYLALGGRQDKIAKIDRMLNFDLALRTIEGWLRLHGLDGLPRALVSEDSR